MKMQHIRLKMRRAMWGPLLVGMLLWMLPSAKAATLTFVVGTTNGVTNSQVVVPIHVTNFTGVGSFQFSFHWNTNIASFMSVEQFGLAGMTTNDFGAFANGTLTVAWFEPSGGVTNVADGSRIFGVRFRLVGPPASTTPVTIDSVPTPLFAASDSTEIPATNVNSILSVDRTLIVTCQNDKVVECGTAWSFDPPVATDSCFGLPVTINILGTTTNMPGTCGFTATRVWEILDPCNNRTVCSQTVTAVDTTPPFVPSCSQSKTVEYGTQWSFDPPIGLDSCYGTVLPVVVATATNAGPCGVTYTAIRTWELMDGCSNKVTCTQTVNVRDTTPPTITCLPNKNVNCLGAWSFDTPAVLDIADGTSLVPVVISTVTNGSCGSSFMVTRTWQATDLCGNSSTCSQTVFGRAIVTVSGTAYVPTNYPSFVNEKRVATAMLLGPTNSTAPTAADGSYYLVFDAANNVVIDPVPPTIGAPADGVSTLDITLLRRHILNIAPLDSPYKLLAGDVDGSSSISTLDLSFVRRLVLGSTNRFPRGLWRFVPSDFVFANPTTPWGAPTNRSYAGVNGDAPNQDFLALKLGDVNNSWTPPPFSASGTHDDKNAAENASKSSSATKKGPTSVGVTNGVTFIAPVSKGLPGNEIVVPVIASGFNFVNGFQFTLRWDTQVVAFVNLEQLGIATMNVGNFNTNFARGYAGLSGTNGVLTVQWDDPFGSAIDLPEGSTVFSVRFQLVGAPSNSTPVKIDGSVTGFEVVDGNLQVATSSAIDGAVYIEQPNRAPVIAAIGNQQVNEGAVLSFAVAVSDADGSIQTQTFNLEPGAPAGASIDPATGVFSWTPTEAQGPGVYSVTVRVTDNGLPAPLNDTETFSVTVNEVNAPPVLNPIGNRVGSEGAPVTFVATASDSDSPAAQSLTFSLDPGAPAGASISPSGAFTWNPGEADGSGNFPITVRVTDNGTPALSASETITISVNEVNTAPTLNPIGNRVVNEGSLLTFTAVASDVDSPAQTLTYSLSNAPAGASINPSSGVFTWTPLEAQGPSTNEVIVRVTDNGSPAATTAQTIVIVVNEVVTAPVLTAIGNKTVNEGGLLNFNVTATDADLPAQTLSYSLDAGFPAGASISSGGVFTWTPTESQGPNVYSITVRVTDSGNPAQSAFETISVTVNESNVVPNITAIGQKTVVKNSQLTFVVNASDADQPAQGLTFSLDPGAPAGASINPNSGVFTWTPDNTQGPATHNITFRVTDNGPGNLSSTTTFSVIVYNDNTPPVLAAIGNKEVTTQTLLTFNALATDAESTSQTLTFSLDPGAPAGANIDPVTGVFTWTPTDVQGPSTNLITVRVSDNAFVPDSDSETIQVVVREFLPPSIEISDVQVPAGTDGSLTAEFQVSLSAPSARPVSVNYATVDGAALGGEDYTPASGVLLFEPGITNLPLDIEVAGKSTVYTNRTFVVQLSNATNGVLADAEGLGTLVAEPAPGLYVSDAAIFEGNSGRANAVFTVNLIGQHDHTVSVNYTAVKGTALTRKDFIPKRGKLTFTPGVSSREIIIPIVGEVMSEYDEDFFVTLSRSVNSVVIHGQGLGVIVDDDASPVLTISDVSTVEKDAGIRALSFTLRLSTKSGRPVSVDFQTADDTATAESDYVPTSGTATIPPGKLLTKVTVPIIGNRTSEDIESFFLNLFNPVNATLGNAQALATIKDNDKAPAVSVSDAQVIAGEGNTRFAIFTVSLSAPSEKGVTINVASSGNTAVADVDYVRYPESPIYFAPGETATNVAVELVDNPESVDRKFYLTATSAINAVIGRRFGTCIIVNP